MGVHDTDVKKFVTFKLLIASYVMKYYNTYTMPFEIPAAALGHKRLLNISDKVHVCT